MGKLKKMQGQGILRINWLITKCSIIQDCIWWQLYSHKQLKDALVRSVVKL